MKLFFSALLTFFLSCPFSLAAETRITPEFARQLLEWNQEDWEKEARLVDNALDNLNSHELRELHQLMLNDMAHGAGIIFSPPLPVEYRIGGRVLNNLEDRLGILNYNKVLEGRITRFVMPTTVSYCYFKPTCGNELEIYIGSSTLGPIGNVHDLTGQDIRMYVRQHPGSSPGEIMNGALKIEFMEDDPDISTNSPWPSPGNLIRGGGTAQVSRTIPNVYSALIPSTYPTSALSLSLDNATIDGYD